MKSIKTNLLTVLKIISTAMLITTFLIKSRNILSLIFRIASAVGIFKFIRSKGIKNISEFAAKYKNELRYSKSDRFGSLALKPNELEILNN